MLVSELGAQLVRASITGVCHAERPGFEPCSGHRLVISLFASYSIFSHPYSDYDFSTGKINEKACHLQKENLILLI